MKTEEIARLCYENTRVLAMINGDHTMPVWELASPDTQAEYVASVEMVKANDTIVDEDLHRAWSETKLRQGWKHGPLCAPDLLEHPDLVPYEQLPLTSRFRHITLIVLTRALLGASEPAALDDDTCYTCKGKGATGGGTVPQAPGMPQVYGMAVCSSCNGSGKRAPMPQLSEAAKETIQEAVKKSRRKRDPVPL